MALAIALVLIIVLAVGFHFASPWWITPIASNWVRMDDMLTITLVITGAFFIAINLFIVVALVRYRHRSGHRAAYEPHNRKLEWWLIGLTIVGVAALLAPGLFVYADYIRPPRNALQMEVLGQQWQWRFRFAGPGGKLGTTDVRYISNDNPFGLNPADPNGRDNYLIDGPEVHLPLNRPVQVLTRSRDVLHDFYVPPFRARMNMVPGMVTTFWFTPTQAGRYDILCAQLCGIGHSGMRGMVVVEDEAAFSRWLAQQTTFAQQQMAHVQAAPAAAGGSAQALANLGKTLAAAKGCVACHTVDGSPLVGPTWKGLYGKTETMADGSTAKVDEAYLRAFIRNPTARVVKGFSPIMPHFDLSEQELSALVAYIEAQGGTPAGTAAQP
ncbi:MULTISPECIES: c-type cytochrome [Burkholderia]|uniref:cytochrome-c oxidase n=1 Tax=Burkholderia contaminans TaxID=488447 RepID=A0A2S5DPN9_9BURK|nr:MULTISPECIES: c-type cytochrome [Burkholderia]EKS9793963.1 cytochrome c oxidase subunit II [Burkholderia cepacia]EKS9803494.1 cytochrome c oxidase subunit II [Burkholderia cepacia]EKS9811626.1 cytochrome c oxidase subunit II [Burkholderia cepacia]EKS9819445.1 cytochrome c oxidase subunit II [Burkholderia cepacia]EKS9826058.1 cytochrome c oxidase subunit II [Burkholderia cepacia]